MNEVYKCNILLKKFIYQTAWQNSKKQFLPKIVFKKGGIT